MRIADTSGREVLRGIVFDAEAGELLALVGPSGAGKTTLGRCLAGLAAGRGTVTVNGELLPAAVSMRSVAQRRAVQYVHQDPRDLPRPPLRPRPGRTACRPATR
jgi:peptide/nickel transport system ATP-binding protein